jgi:hypothetical protein
MFRIRWEEPALEQLTTLWMGADSGMRRRITEATQLIDQKLKADPLAESESRPEGRRILFASPLGITFRIEDDGRTVSVLRVWLFRMRGHA